jgi:hypothetical protein
LAPLRNTKLYALAQRVASLDEGLIFEVVFNQKHIKDEIIRLNTSEQLFEGIDSKGNPLDVYSPTTEVLNLRFTFNYEGKSKKKIAGQPAFLFDEGEFYTSFQVDVDRNRILIKADPIKDDGNNLFDEYGNDIIGLTDESKRKLSEMAVIEYQNYWRNNILRT